MDDDERRAKRRTKRRTTRVVCSGCGGFPMSGLVEVGAVEADMGAALEGERYCRPCARRRVVL